MNTIKDVEEGKRKAILIRVGIDYSKGGMYAPIFEDGTFEYIPIPSNCGKRKYSDIVSKHDPTKHLSDYFPERAQFEIEKQMVHEDPEFETFTYGDPAISKRGLRKLQKDDMLIFYCGLQHGLGRKAKRALYLMGYFNVECAGEVSSFKHTELLEKFSKNHHIENAAVFRKDRANLTLVKGMEGSRLLTKAVHISFRGKDRAGHPLLQISSEMQQIFSDFDGKKSLQRASIKVVTPNKVETVIHYMNDLE